MKSSASKIEVTGFDVGRQIEAERNGIIKNEEKRGRNGTNKKAA